ncbi:MAG: hypothetical protein ACRDF9_12585 [Candidatus Limnocylindria bacterium]
MRTPGLVMRVEATKYVWVRWLVDGSHSSWHQVREDSVPHLLEGEVLQVLRLWTRCGFEVPDPEALEVWPGSSMPVGQTCVYCTRSYLVGTLPPLGTPPVPEGGRVRLITGPRRKGSTQAPSVPAEGAATPR